MNESNQVGAVDAAGASEPIVVVENVVKRFGKDTVLDGATFTIRRGELVGLTGPSGSGKSTLVHLLGALDNVDAGTVRVDGITLGHHGLTSLAKFRREHVGIVFQLHNLVPRLTAAQNVELAMFSTHRSRAERSEHARELLEQVGLGTRLDRRPPQLSGGERARVALARGLANDPPVLLADEPTGNLDDVSTELVSNEIRRLAHDKGVAVLVVSHDPRFNVLADRLLHLDHGRITEVQSTAR